MRSIKIEPIGIIHSPYASAKDIPSQGYMKENVEAVIEINKKFNPAMKDIKGFSHLIVLFYFHKSKQTHMRGHPSWEDTEHGVFALRSPHRPNHIGMTVINVKEVHDNKIVFSNVDMLDGTPVIDIKPYVGEFERIKDPSFGWLEKHRE
jgi:tRNA-Thr(GGU) m(6)t(6)A37 methyltransferase TsaA